MNQPCVLAVRARSGPCRSCRRPRSRRSGRCRPVPFSTTLTIMSCRSLATWRLTTEPLQLFGLGACRCWSCGPARAAAAPGTAASACRRWRPSRRSSRPAAASSGRRAGRCDDCASAAWSSPPSGFVDLAGLARRRPAGPSPLSRPTVRSVWSKPKPRAVVLDLVGAELDAELGEAGVARLGQRLARG